MNKKFVHEFLKKLHVRRLFHQRAAISVQTVAEI